MGGLWFKKDRPKDYQPAFIKNQLPEATSKLSPNSYNNAASWKAAYQMKSDFVGAKGPKINFATEHAKRKQFLPGVGTYGKD